MKNILFALLFAGLAGQTVSGKSNDENDPGKLSVSVNPMGFLFFGPTMDLSVRITPRNLVSVHYRQTSLGLITKKIKEEDEPMGDLTAQGYGAGFTRFHSEFGRGIYYGGAFSYDKLYVNYSIDQPYKWFEEVNSFAFCANGGTRIPLNRRFYVNVGGFLGAVYSKSYWDYSDLAVGASDPDPRNSTTFKPAGMLEVAFGVNIL